MKALLMAAYTVSLLILGESLPMLAQARQVSSDSKTKEGASQPSPVVAHPNPQPKCSAIDLRYPDGKQVNLTGVWWGNTGYYYLRQDGDCLWWAGFSQDNGLRTGTTFSNVFAGKISTGFSVTGDWADVPRGKTLGSGTLNLFVNTWYSGGQDFTEIIKQSEIGDRFGDARWTPIRPPTPYSGGCLFDDINCILSAVKKNGGDSLYDNLKPYKENVVVFGSVASPVTNTFPTENSRSYCSFFSVGSDTDADMVFDLAWNYLYHPQESNYASSIGWVRSKRDIDAKLQFQIDHNIPAPVVHAELIMFGRPTGGDNCHSEDRPLQPGWNENGADSVLLNGRPIEGQVQSGNVPAILGHSMAINAQVRLSGALVLDCGHSSWWPPELNPCYEENADQQNVEIHPVYAVDVLQDWTLPRPNSNLTGAWAASDAGTYYVRQVGNTIWWLGMSPDQGITFANVFKGTIQGNTITGDWVDVPLGAYLNKGQLNLRGTSCVNGSCNAAVPVPQMNRLGTWSTSNGIFGGYDWEKLYDEPPPQRTVNVTFLNAKFFNAPDPNRAASIRLNFTVNNQTMVFPSEGARQVAFGSEIDFPQTLHFTLTPNIYDSLRISVYAHDDNVDPCQPAPHMPCPPAMHVSDGFGVGNNFGAGLHPNEGSIQSAGESFQLTYRIDVN